LAFLSLAYYRRHEGRALTTPAFQVIAPQTAFKREIWKALAEEVTQTMLVGPAVALVWFGTARATLADGT